MPAIYERGDYEIVLESNFLQTLKQFAVVVAKIVSNSWFLFRGPKKIT